MNAYIVCVLIALGLHRLWNYEDIFARARARFPRFKPISCAACNAFWVSLPVAAGAWLLGELRLLAALTLPLAAYPILRAAVGVYRISWAAPTLPSAVPAAPGIPAVAAADKPGCSSCEAKKAALDAERGRTDQFAKRIVIITDQHDLTYRNPVAAWVFTHAVAVAKNPKYLVQVWAAEGADPSAVPSDLPSNVEVKALLPVTNDATKIAATLTDGLIWLGNATVITERLWGSKDQPAIAAALDQVGLLSAFAWLHILDPSDGVQPLLPHHLRIRPDVALMKAVDEAVPIPIA